MDSRRVVHKHEVAKHSVDDLAEHLATEASFKVALRFLERAEEAFALILRSPGIGHPQQFRSLNLSDIRAWHVRGVKESRASSARLCSGVGDMCELRRLEKNGRPRPRWQVGCSLGSPCSVLWRWAASKPRRRA